MQLLTLYIGVAVVCGLLTLFVPPKLPRYWLLLIIAAIPQIGLIYGIHIPGMVLVSAACVAVWGMANARNTGLVIAAVGMLMNLLVMAWHGGRMPIAATLLADIGWAHPVGATLAGSKDLVVAGSPLLWLSDHIIIDWLGMIASPGDVVVLIGILWWFVQGLAHQRRRIHACATPPAPYKDHPTTLLAGR